MPAVTGAFSNHLAPGLRYVFFMHLKDREKEYEKIFTVMSTKRHYEEHLEVAALGALQTKSEGASISYQDFIEGELKRFTQVTYGLGFRVTEEMMEGDLYGTMNKNARALRRSALNSEETVAFNVLNLSFTTAYGFPKSGSNESLINSSHTLLGGGSASNQPSSMVDISFAALEAAILHYNTLEDERGMPLDLKPATLLYHPNDLFLVQQLLGSPNEPFTMDHQINPLRNALRPIWSRYLTDTDAWWVLAEKDEAGLVMYKRRPLRLQNGDDFDSGDAKFKATYRSSVGCSEWRFLYGSSGA